MELEAGRQTKTVRSPFSLQVPLKPKDDVNMNEGRHYSPVRYPLLVAPFELDSMTYLNDAELKEGRSKQSKTLEKSFDA